MDEFLKNIESCYYEIAEQSISKLTASSIYLAHKYILKFPLIENKPLVLGIPFKGELGIYLAAGLLKNFFNEDYILHSDAHFKKLDLSDGDRIKVFGNLTTWNSSTSNKNGRVQLKTTSPGSYGQTTTQLNSRDIQDSWLPYIEKIGGATTRVIKFKTFYDSLKKQRINRKPIDNFLNYNEDGFGIPTQALKSKIILITGRGQKSKTIDKLKKTIVFEDSMYNLLIKTNGLEVHPDLKNYVDLFHVNNKEIVKNWINDLGRLIHFVNDYGGGEILQLLENGDIFSDRFGLALQDFEDYIDEIGNRTAINNLEELKNIIPKETTTISKDIRCIIIDDPTLLLDYQKTVKGFLDRGVPIILLNDFSQAIESEHFFNDCFKFYYSKQKINYLCEASNDIVFDCEILKRNFNYSKQKVSFQIVEDFGFEKLAARVSNEIYELEGFENLKKEFWNKAYPVLHIVKNGFHESFSKYESILNSFFKYYNQIKNQLSDETNTAISNLFSSEWINPKIGIDDSIGFNQKIQIGSSVFKYDFKNTIKSTYKLKSDIDIISFSGEPFKEYNQGHIFKAILKYCIPEIKMILFKREFNNIKYRLGKGFKYCSFSDDVSFVQSVSEDFRCTIETIENEFNGIFSNVNLNDSEVKFTLDKVYKKYVDYTRSKYFSKVEDEDALDCQTFNFSNNEWMFIAKNSNVYIASENDDDKIEVVQTRSGLVKRGDLLILYSLDVSQLTRLASHNTQLQESLKTLDIWKTILISKKAYLSYNQLNQEIENVKTNEYVNANPSIPNIRNWCNDQDIISPLTDNLKLILKYGNKLEMFQEIYNARRNVIAFRNAVRKEIKNKLKQKLPKILLEKDPNSDFIIDIKGLSMEIQTREISSISIKLNKVAYHNIKKLIKD